MVRTKYRISRKRGKCKLLCSIYSNSAIVFESVATYERRHMHIIRLINLRMKLFWMRRGEALQTAHTDPETYNMEMGFVLGAFLNLPRVYIDIRLQLRHFAVLSPHRHLSGSVGHTLDTNSKAKLPILDTHCRCGQHTINPGTRMRATSTSHWTTKMPPQTFVVTVDDVLECWSGGLGVATENRVHYVRTFYCRTATLEYYGRNAMQ